MIDPILIYASAASLAGILLLGSMEKLRSFSLFRGVVSDYALLPGSLVTPFATAFLTAEAAAGILLLIPATRSMGALLAGLLMLAGTLGISINLLRGRREIDCGCGGFTKKSGGLTWWLVARNGVLLGLAIPALLASHSLTRTLAWIDGLTFLGATLAVLGLYFSLNQLIDSHTKLQKL